MYRKITQIPLAHTQVAIKIPPVKSNLALTL